MMEEPKSAKGPHARSSLFVQSPDITRSPLGYFSFSSYPLVSWVIEVSHAENVGPALAWHAQSLESTQSSTQQICHSSTGLVFSTCGVQGQSRPWQSEALFLQKKKSREQSGWTKAQLRLWPQSHFLARLT